MSEDKPRLVLDPDSLLLLEEIRRNGKEILYTDPGDIASVENAFHGVIARRVALDILLYLKKDEFWKFERLLVALMIDKRTKDPMFYMRVWQHFAEIGLRTVVRLFIRRQNDLVKDQRRSTLMNCLRCFTAVSEYIAPVRRLWQRKEDLWPPFFRQFTFQKNNIYLRHLVGVMRNLVWGGRPRDLEYVVVKNNLPDRLIALMAGSAFATDPAISDLMTDSYLMLMCAAECGGPVCLDKLRACNLRFLYERLCINEAEDRKIREISPKELEGKEIVYQAVQVIEDPKKNVVFGNLKRAKRLLYKDDMDADRVVFCSSPACSKHRVLSEAKFRHCSRCMLAYYCSQECQENDWTEHEQYCWPVLTK